MLYTLLKTWCIALNIILRSGRTSGPGGPAQGNREYVQDPHSEYDAVIR